MLQKNYVMYAIRIIIQVRELIPEFYFLPEMFLNLQKLNLGKTNIQVHNVHLPDYANDSPFLYVCCNRIALDDSICGDMLHEWIDLIWGYKSRGKGTT